MSKVLVLGAGFTGLAAGHKIGATIYEASDVSGGICRSYKLGGYSFEVGGGHWLFGSGKAIDFIKSFVDMDEYQRDAGIFYNTIIPYPIQTFADKDEPVNAGTLQAWLRGKFGNRMGNMFFYPFNKSYTAGLYDRIIQDDEYKSPNPGGVGFVPSFYYPKDGWNGFIDKLAAKCDIRYNKRVVSIDEDDKVVMFADGSDTYYDRLISTIPLCDTLKFMAYPNFKLPYTSVLVVNIGADKGVNFPKEHWLYVPFSKSGFFRMGFYSNVVPTKAPEGKCSISVERAFEHDDELSGYSIEEELVSLGIIKNINVVKHIIVKHAYTWLYPDSEREKYLGYLKSKDIDSIGRYGAWKFTGMAGSIEQGLNV